MSGDKDWTRGVYVSISLGNYKLIPSTRAAINLLMSVWPVTNGSRYLNALVICQAAMDSRLTPKHSRLSSWKPQGRLAWRSRRLDRCFVKTRGMPVERYQNSSWSDAPRGVKGHVYLQPPPEPPEARKLPPSTPWIRDFYISFRWQLMLRSIAAERI
jgi:hypothetical protein